VADGRDLYPGSKASRPVSITLSTASAFFACTVENNGWPKKVVMTLAAFQNLTRISWQTADATYLNRLPFFRPAFDIELMENPAT
jgi:hypothetical protein